jgi:hypothetical protein
MTSSLVRCSTCKRHIYASETTCPFCVRTGNPTSGSIAVALTAAASIALAGCANDPPKNDAATAVTPDAKKTEATVVAPKPTPPQVAAPAPNPTPVATEPAAAPPASSAMAPTPPATPTTTTQVNPQRNPVPAYGLPRPTATQTAPRRPPVAAYGAPPPRPGDLD